MHRVAYYTGSFDPMHAGHVWSIKAAHKKQPFKKLILAVGYNNTKKPGATAWSLRADMAKATLEAASLPFEVEVMPFDYQRAIEIIKNDIPMSNCMRIVGSDSLIAFIADMQGKDEMWEHLLPHRHMVLVRAMAGAQLDELKAAIGGLSQAVGSRFTYQVVGVHDKPIASTQIRQDVYNSYKQGLITKEVYDYIKKHKLYNLSSANAKLATGSKVAHLQKK